MSETENESKWRLEFEESGEAEIREALSRGAIYNSEVKRQFAYRWLREKAKSKALQERQMYRYIQWTLWAAIAAVLVGIISIFVTWLH